MRSLCWLPFLVAAAGCWQPRYFEPRENVTGTSPEGLPAAVYELSRGGDDRARGQLRVWSDGAQARYAAGDEEVVDLHLAIELENNGAGPLEVVVGSLQVEELSLAGALQPPMAPVDVAGAARAGPGATSRLDVVFRPSTTYPSDVDTFSLRWAVRGVDGDLAAEVTPFAPIRARFGPGGLMWGDPTWSGAYWGAGPRGFYGPWSWGGAWGWSVGARRCR